MRTQWPKSEIYQIHIRRVMNDALDELESLNNDEAITSLVRLKGVGRWTAEMILIFFLGREDVWPCDDAGLMRAANRLYGTANLQEFIELGERFRPFRTHAAWYLWASLDNQKVEAP